MNINWYPGHMTKARRAIAPKLKLIDIVIEALDSRAPQSSINPDFDDLMQGKTRIKVLCKSDLADPAVTREWLAYFNRQGIPAVSYSTRSPAAPLRAAIESSAADIYERYRQKGMKKTVRFLVCGIPNVGKSAMINRLAGSKRVKEGNKPGVTRGLTWVKLGDYLEVMDSPGLLWPKIETEEQGAALALIGSIRTEVLDEEQLAFYLLRLLSKTAPEQLMERYKLESLPDDAYELMLEIGRKRGFLMRGAEVNEERTAAMLLDEYKSSKIGRISLEKPL